MAIVASAHYWASKTVFIDKHYVETMWRKKNAEKYDVETMWKSKTQFLGKSQIFNNYGKNEQIDHLGNDLTI